MENIWLYNSLGRKKELFVPIKKNEVGMYCCGPTVYGFAHLGNLRTYLFEDILRRVFEYNGYLVRHVINITDVGHLTSNEDIGEDKIEMSASKMGKTVWDIANFYTEAFLADLKKLNILMPMVMPRATEHIDGQIMMIESLERKGYTYRTSDGIYFDVSKWKDYGVLSGQKLEEKLAGTRIMKNSEKKHDADFALWKFSPLNEKRQMEWKSPWVEKGFPGWHIECSAMSQHYLGNHFDIHCGGVDHIAVHHENEIAQSEAANGQKYVNYWLHGEFMTIDGKRMGKSEGNAFLLENIEARGFLAQSFRFLNLGTHYRIQLNFTWEALEAADKALRKLYLAINQLKTKVRPGVVDPAYKEKFTQAVNNDLNMSVAMSTVWAVLKSDLADEVKLATVFDFDRVLGFDLANNADKNTVSYNEEIQAILNARAEARRLKNYAESDRLRDKLLELGYVVKDGLNGQQELIRKS